MRSKNRVNEASDNMTLVQLRAIQDNQYRSSCGNYDYYPESIDKAINRILTKDNEESFGDNANAIKSFILNKLQGITCPKLRKLWKDYLLDEMEAKGIY